MKEEHIRKYYLTDAGSSCIRPEKLYDLRPLSDMTEEEAIEVARLIADKESFKDHRIFTTDYGDLVVQWGNDLHFFNSTGEIFYTPEQFHYLLKQRFDVFGILNK